MQERKAIELEGGWSFMEVCYDTGQGVFSLADGPGRMLM